MKLLIHINTYMDWKASKHLKTWTGERDVSQLHYKHFVWHWVRWRVVLTGDFPAGPVAKLLTTNAGAWLQSLVRELKSHMLYSTTKQINKFHHVPLSYILKHIIFLNWSIVNLQFYVSFRCIAWWFSISAQLYSLRLLQDNGHNSLCYTAGPYCLYISYIAVNPISLIYPSPLLSSLVITELFSMSCVYESVSVLAYTFICIIFRSHI